MTDVRTCPTCGTPEHRWIDANGKPQVNLNPLNGLCLNCSIEFSKEIRSMQPASLPFDARAAAANDRSES